MNILDPRFRYTSSVATDLRKTFARIRRRHLEQQPSAEVAPPGAAKVVALTVRRRTAA